MNSISITIRDETASDVPVIREITAAAFAGAEHSDGGEPDIIDALRRDGALTHSIVATVESDGGSSDATMVVGHVAASRVRIDGNDLGWYGIGPLSVHPDSRGRRIGSALMNALLDRLRGDGAAGVVLLGEPGYYGRFGFSPIEGLIYPSVPAEYFMAMVFNRYDGESPGGEAECPRGVVSYHSAFGG